jgi:hypothetical protein
MEDGFDIGSIGVSDIGGMVAGVVVHARASVQGDGVSGGGSSLASRTR